jgi:hypothetical protein
MNLTLQRACEIANYPPKLLTDDRPIIRQETGGLDIVPWAGGGRIVCDIDDAAALLLYAEMRRARLPVKYAGAFAARIRAAMSNNPNEPQFTTVLLGNGSTFTLPISTLDLSSGLSSGSYVVTATTVDVRRLRERVQREIDAYEPQGEEANEAA